MLRRTAFLALSSLALSGCVTYEVVERRVYHEDGSYTRLYDPYDDGRRYEDRRYDDDGRRYRGYDDPYDRWFYGYRGYGSAWALDPYFSDRRSSVHIVYGSRWSQPWGYFSPWYAPSWSGRWGWAPYGYGGHDDYGHGYGYTPSRPHAPRPHTPRPVEARPMPKPTVRSVGPDVSMPVMRGPSVGGEALRPAPREQRWDTPPPRASMPEATSRPKPQPEFERPVEQPRFEPREPERVFERPVEQPRFEPREPERVFERPVEQPRFEPREPAPVFERRVEEPRFEPREAPRDTPEVEERAD